MQNYTYTIDACIQFHLQEFWDPVDHLFNGNKTCANASLSWPIICAPLTVRELFSSLFNVWQPKENW